MKPSLILFLDFKKANKKVDRVPLVARIIFKRQKAERTIDKVTSANALLWDQFKQSFTGKEANQLNFIKNNFELSFKRFEVDHWDDIYQFSAKDILNLLTQPKTIEVPETKLIVIDKLEEYFSEKILPNKHIVFGTKKNYRKSINHLIQFLEAKKLKHISLNEFTNNLGKQFYEYLLGNTTLKHAPSLKAHSAAAIISKLRVIFSDWESQQWITTNAMKAMKLTKKYPQKPRLDIEQIKAIKNLDLSNNKFLEKSRDVFLFFFFIGQSYTDMMSIKKMNLKKYTDDWILEGRRNKTQESYKIYLHSYAKQLVDKFDILPETNITGNLLPKVDMVCLNRNLKLIAAMCNIQINLSSNIARHTFRQLAAEAGIYDIAVIKKMMGHTPINDIDSNYFIATDKNLKEASLKYEKFLQSHFEADIDVTISKQ